MPDPMPSIDYMGPQGGAMAMAFGGGVVFASAVWSGTVALLWRLFGDKRIKALETELANLKITHAADRAEERRRCDHEIDEIRQQLTMFQTIVLTSGSPALRQAMQAAVSEARITADADRTEQ